MTQITPRGKFDNLIFFFHVCPCLGFVGMMFVFKEHSLQDTPFQQQAKRWD